MKIHPRWQSIGTAFLLVALAAIPGGAVTYLSVEPIPNQDVVGQQALDHLVGLPFEVRELWAELLLGCGLVEGVIDALQADGTITTINRTNTIWSVAAGGFEGQTNPTYLFTIVDSNVNAASVTDIETLANALGYVLSQGGTIHFSADDAMTYDFSLDYVTATFTAGPPSGALAQEFFAHVGTIDEELFTGSLAGYTQIGAALLFLQPAAETQRFVEGIFAAAMSFPGVEFAPLDMNGDPTSVLAGVAFRGNDWLADPAGGGYLANITQNPGADLGRIGNLNDWRRFHLRASRVLSRQAAGGRFAGNGVRALNRIFSCER